MFEKLFQENQITGISINSRTLKKGDVFFAFKGLSTDGNNYIDEAFSKGAGLVISDKKPIKPNSKIFYVENIKEGLRAAAEIIYPKKPQNLVAVTGTNGKTSVVTYCQQLFELLGVQSASIGTIGVTCTDKELGKVLSNEENFLTSPDFIDLRKILNSLSERKINFAAFEASSHGLEQSRLKGILVGAAAFTSLSRDHLDYHLSMENYLKAKLILFKDNLKEGARAVINSEINEIEQIKQFLQSKPAELITIGKSGDLKVKVKKLALEGQVIECLYKGSTYQFQTDILGTFQADNILTAALLVEEFGFDFKEILQLLPMLKAACGRLERVTTINHPFHIFVDFAHTPDSLEKTLIELTRLKKENGRLLVIFGCGGDRDAGKRPLMGRIAAKYADQAIITDDNPRFEEASQIRAAILKEVPKGIEIEPRQDAITATIKTLQKDDILLIAGKGHENYQIIKGQKLYMSDQELVRKALG